MDAEALFKRMWKLGMGTVPKQTTRTYEMVVRLVNFFGDRALFLLHDVLDYAQYKDNPGHWFRCVIGDRFRQAGMCLTKCRAQKRQRPKIEHVVNKFAETTAQNAPESTPKSKFVPKPGETFTEANERRKREKRLAEQAVS